MLSFISLNSRGLRNNVKRKATFLFCKEQKANLFVVFKKPSQWKLTQSFGNSNGTPHSAGVMILINRFSGNIIDHISDSGTLADGGD